MPFVTTVWKEVVKLGKKTKAKDKKKYQTFHVYFGDEYKGLFEEFKKLAAQVKGVSPSALIVVSALACIDELKKKVPQNRNFTLNGVKVEM